MKVILYTLSRVISTFVLLILIMEFYKAIISPDNALIGFQGVLLTSRLYLAG